VNAAIVDTDVVSTMLEADSRAGGYRVCVTVGFLEFRS
jgi:hypothetical protein